MQLPEEYTEFIYKNKPFDAFLMENYFPIHDEVCHAEGHILRRHFAGDKQATAVLAAMKGQLPALQKKYSIFDPPAHKPPHHDTDTMTALRVSVRKQKELLNTQFLLSYIQAIALTAHRRDQPPRRGFFYFSAKETHIHLRYVGAGDILTLGGTQDRPKSFLGDHRPPIFPQAIKQGLLPRGQRNFPPGHGYPAVRQGGYIKFLLRRCIVRTCLSPFHHRGADHAGWIFGYDRLVRQQSADAILQVL